MLQADQRDTPEVQKKRRAFRRQAAKVDPKHLVFIDESGADTAMPRTHGRAPAGQWVTGAVPADWSSVTLVCGVYAHVGLIDQTAALDAQPDLTPSASKTEANVLVVMDVDGRIKNPLAHHLPTGGDGTSRSLSQLIA